MLRITSKDYLEYCWELELPDASLLLAPLAPLLPLGDSMALPETTSVAELLVVPVDVLTEPLAPELPDISPLTAGSCVTPLEPLVASSELLEDGALSIAWTSEELELPEVPLVPVAWA